MQAFLYVHDPIPPFRLKGEIRTATDIDRLLAIDEPGTMTFRCSSEEISTIGIAGYAFSLAAGGFKEGDAIVDRSDAGIHPTLWYVARITDSLEEGMVSVEAIEWSNLLYRRQVPLNFVTSSQSADGNGRALLRQINGRHPTHIKHRPESGFDSATMRPLVEHLALGGMSLAEALNELALRTDTEWWVDYRIDWNTADPVLRWSHRRGRDQSERVVMDEGYHVISASYTRDVSDAARTVQVIGGSDDVANAPSATMDVGDPAIATSDPGGGRKEPSDELAKRIARAAPPPAVISDAFEIRPSEASERSLVNATRTLVRLPLVALRSLETTLRWVPDLDTPAVSLSNIPYWSTFRLGDTVRFRLASADFGRGVDLLLRVVAMQPDEASGEMPIVVEVQEGVVTFQRGDV